MYPRVIISSEKLKTNTEKVVGMAKPYGIDVFAVTKVFCAHSQIAQVLLKGGVKGLADSRIENLKTLGHLGVTRLLLRIPMISEVKEVVRHAEISLQSELATLRALDVAAKDLGVRHKVVLMVDLGDLREGVLPEQVETTVRAIEALEAVTLCGIGVNLTCYGGVIPDEDNLGELGRIATDVEALIGRPLEYISGGNSSSLYLLENGKMPSKINQLRVGETLVLGRETAYGATLDGTYDDAFILEAEIVELKEKGSVPKGKIGMNAFGETPHFEDRGKILRAIVAIGQQDVVVDGLQPLDEKIDILGASSDHMLLDVTRSDSAYAVGDILAFKMDYSAMLKLFTSKYVDKVLESLL
ncbi:ornithine racemase Orr [Fusibacter sp. JL298sf-3]